jgi:Tripartite tricarboxylate transporter TctB family
MQIKNGKDFWAGLMYLAFGAAFMLVARNYAMGSALRMGPAYFPTVLGGILVVLGLTVFVRSFTSHIIHSWRIFKFNFRTFIPAVVIGIPAFMWQKEMYAAGGQWLVYAVNGVGILLFFASFGKRSLFQILVMTILFGYMLKPLGLVISTIVLILGAAKAGHEFKFKEVAIMAVVLAIFSSLAFVKGLGLPFPIWPDLGN